MKLWQKNYLVTALLFTGVLFVCTAMLIAPVVRMTLGSAKNAAIQEEKAIAHVLEMLLVNNKAEPGVIETIAKTYAQNGTYLQMVTDQRTQIGTLPIDAPTEPGTLCWLRHDGQWYLAIGDALFDGSELVYLREVSARVRAAAIEGLGAVGVCLLLCGLVDLALYYTMQQINKPLSRLSHELRTPLTVIRGYAELLQLAALSEEQRHEAASYIVGESDRLQDITQKLLTLHDRTGAGRERISLESLAKRLRMTWEGVRIEEKGDAIYGDPALLISLLDNLIGNAKKAAPNGTVSVYLTETAFTVRDDGCGMDEQMLAYVNDPQHKPLPDGVRSGLGVPLCHEIARLHGARLVYRSEPGAGTEATFFTTLKQSDDDFETGRSVR